MKKYFFLLLLSLGTLAVQAQKKTMKSKHMSKDCVVMQDGKMMAVRNGDTTAMDSNMTMRNGAVVMTDGTLKMKNGKTMQLKNGDCVMMDGTVKHEMAMKRTKTKAKTGY